MPLITVEGKGEDYEGAVAAELNYGVSAESATDIRGPAYLFA